MSVNITSQKNIPSLIGNAGKVLITDGANVSWSALDATPVVKGLMYGETTTNGVALGYNTKLLSYQVAIGESALASATSGNGNVAVGSSALTQMVSGQANTAVGSYAAYVTLGSRNTAIGAETIRAIGGQSSSDNTAVGYRALYWVSSGNNNTAIGSEAGVGTGVNVNTSGSNNTFIGYRAVGTSSGASNVITLGNSSIATLRCQVTSITALSDARDKKDVVDLPIGLDFINKIRPVKFTWDMRQPSEPQLDSNGNPEVYGKVNIPDSGFIAQELLAAEDEEGVSEWLQLTYRDNPDSLEATQGRLIPVLVKAIQELTARVEALEANNQSA